MQIYINREGQMYGPFSREACIEGLSSGNLTNEDLAWQDGMPDWLPLHSVLGAKLVHARLPQGKEGGVQLIEYSDSKSTSRVAA
jgi:hypothetical protein